MKVGTTDCFGINIYIIFIIGKLITRPETRFSAPEIAPDFPTGFII